MNLMQMNNGHGKIIAFTGAQGTGKSTAAVFWGAAIQADYPEKTVRVVSDIERECPYPINREATPEAQEWIFFRHLMAETEAALNCDVVVSDRTLMDVIAYSRTAGFRAQVDEMLQVWKVHVPYYQKIIFRRILTNYWNVDDGVRDTDPEFRARVEANLYGLYRYAGVTSQARFSEV